MKAQSQVVSAIIVILIALALLALVVPWALTMIQKKKDMKSLDDVYNFFQTLDKTIRDIANNGGEESLSLKVPGRLEVYPASFSSPLNNSIIFSFDSKVSNIAVGVGEIPLNTPNTNETASLGVDAPSVIFGNATRINDEIRIRYRLWYRTLEDSSNHAYKIVLNTSNDEYLNSTTGFLRIQRLGSEFIESKNLTITKINVII